MSNVETRLQKTAVSYAINIEVGNELKVFSWNKYGKHFLSLLF